jgi:2-keto-4-pentenoate hydratase/2-oxohepta-3-ene-1,7-dioic acid hydratase in catechol pathway
MGNLFECPTISFQVIAEGKHKVPLQEVKLLSPISDCEKVICIGMNYADHCAEQNQPIPAEPLVFSKFSNTIIGDGEFIGRLACYFNVFYFILSIYF